MTKHHYDSRHIRPGDTFICLPNGEAYIQNALSNGATEVTHMSRKEMALFASEHYNAPSDALTVIGITGTNGKTTVAHLVHTLLMRLGYHSCLSGTLTHALTTPESLDTQRLMSEHLANNGTHYVMEVSSHGIDQHRVDQINFDVTCLTNITQDHLDYHGTFEAYKQCKLSFLQNFGSIVSIKPDDYKAIKRPDPSPLIGQFNQENLQATIAILLALNIDEHLIYEHLPELTPPPGRLERVIHTHPFEVVVDYAHTPDALENVLNTLTNYNSNQGKLICVFGCGGNRDTDKRPKMGAIAGSLSDYVILTSDNPRNEDPEQILSDIESGLSNQSNYTKISDRKKAIEAALSMATPHDLILIAGKGHETYQIIGETSYSFDDREVASEFLKEKTH